MSDETEDRYEAIELIVKSRDDGEAWFDRIFDFIAGECKGGPVDEHEGGEEFTDCTCGMEHMGGSSGTLEQCYFYTNTVGHKLLPIDLARAIVALTDRSFNSLGTHEEQIAAEGVIKAINWAHDEIRFEEYFENREWEDKDDQGDSEESDTM